ncbi:hypothetical protein V8C86DRAFT_2892710 [Haematococcus lacustris]
MAGSRDPTASAGEVRAAAAPEPCSWELWAVGGAGLRPGAMGPGAGCEGSSMASSRLRVSRRRRSWGSRAGVGGWAASWLPRWAKAWATWGSRVGEGLGEGGAVGGRQQSRYSRVSRSSAWPYTQRLMCPAGRQRPTSPASTAIISTQQAATSRGTAPGLIWQPSWPSGPSQGDSSTSASSGSQERARSGSPCTSTSSRPPERSVTLTSLGAPPAELGSSSSACTRLR